MPWNVFMRWIYSGQNLNSMFAHHDIIIWMLIICIICCLYSFVCLCTWLSLLVNYSLIFVFLVKTTGLILLVLNIIMYLTRNHLVWFRTFITLLLVLLLTCSISHFIVIVYSWNANKIQIQTRNVIDFKQNWLQYTWL